MTAPALQIEGLVKTFRVGGGLGRAPAREVRAVDGVSLLIPQGGIYGLAGESGSGKSTIARIVMGLARADAGRVLVDGQDLSGNPALRAKVQMVFQNPGASLNPRRSVGQQIALPLAAHAYPGDRRARLAELLDMVHLPAAFAGRFPHELSGGQKQRVAIARALAVGPRLLVLDEPTSALDVSVQARVIALLEELGRSLGLSFLFISHDLSLMRNFAREVGVLYRGRLVEEGPVERVFARPAHDYTRLLLASVPVVSDEEAALRPVIPLIDGELPTAEELLALRARERTPS